MDLIFGTVVDAIIYWIFGKVGGCNYLLESTSYG